MFKNIFTLLFTLIIVSTSSNAQENSIENNYSKTADRIVNYSMTEMNGYDWLKDLCENIGPRLSGSEASMEAIYWAKSKFETMGLDSVWLQPVMVPKWIRGDIEKAAIVESENFKGRDLNVASLGGSISTPASGINSKVIEIHSFDELEKRADEIKDNIVFFNRPFDHKFVHTFSAYGDAVDQRVNGPSKAAKFGASAVLVRSVSSKNDNVPHVGTLSYADSITQIPAASIGIEDANFLSEAILNEPNLQVNLKMDCKNLGSVKSYNVIAQINGSELPEEIIAVGGHWDSWDKGCGAHDDGAPCIQTMEVLDIFKKLKLNPKRTIRCVLFINEENGVKGAHAYADSAANNGEYHVAAIESDRGVFTPRGFHTNADSISLQNMQNWLSVLNKSSIDWIRKGGTGVDISKIKNVKALFGYVPDSQRYFDVHHSGNDTFDSVNPREMQLGTASIAILTYLLSEEGL